VGLKIRGVCDADGAKFGDDAARAKLPTSPVFRREGFQSSLEFTTPR